VHVCCKPVEAVVTRQRLNSRHVVATADTCATTEELLETVFSVRSVLGLYNEDQLALSVREFRGESRVSLQADIQLRVAVAESRDSLGTQRKGNFRR
jgi:hypothetical protein